jgi:large subunit ribosomal protein L14e
MIEVGRLCVKTAGRDAGNKCVIIDVVDEKFVMIDGETRRRKCNVKHLEPLKEMIKMVKNASHKDVVDAFKKLGIDIKETKPRKAQPKLRQVRAGERKKLAPKEQKKDKAERPKEELKKKEGKLEKAIEE